MTVYEKLMKDVARLNKAEAKCLETGALSMGFEYRLKIIDLRRKAAKLPSEEAIRPYSAKVYIRNLIGRRAPCQTI